MYKLFYLNLGKWGANLASGRLARGDLKVPLSESEHLRVLAVIPGISDGASFVFVKRQVASLANLQVDMRTFFLHSRTSPQALLRDWGRFKREVRQFHPHLIHAHYGSVTSLFCVVSSNIPLVITFRGSDLNGNRDSGILRSYVAQLLSQISCLGAERVICVSHRLRNRLWWRRSRAVVIPTGVDLHLFHPRPKDQARALLGWEQGVPIVVFHGGNFPRHKGLPFVLAAVRVAEEAVGLIRLMILDVPPELVPYCLSAADCLALASVNEGSPNIVKEALACNLPVVSTDVGDVAERLKEVHPSKVVRRDVFEFGKALAEIVLEKRASNGRDSIGNCDEVCIAEAIRCVYETSVKATRASGASINNRRLCSL
jgi:teichuronic acid biosynthesis glycosyltransferase TuaC